MATASRRTRLLLASALLFLVAASLFAAGSPPLRWSLAALVGGTPQEGQAHLSPRAAVVGTAEPARLLKSPIGRELRPDLDRLAASQGFDLSLAEEQFDRAWFAGDGGQSWSVVGTGVPLSPLWLPKVNEDWHAAGPFDGRQAVTDGNIVLTPLGPGLVLAAPVASQSWALEGALPARAAPPRVDFDGDDQALRARVVIDSGLQQKLLRELPPQARFLATTLSVAELRLAVEDTLGIEVDLNHRGEPAARQSELLFQQVNSFAKAARSAGPLARAILGEQAELLMLVPELNVKRDGVVVIVTADCDAEILRGWLGRAEAALTSRDQLP
jgi:hypothetical protein